MRAKPSPQLIERGRLPADSCRHGVAVDGLERPSGRTASRGITPSPIMPPAPPGPRAEIRLGARAHTQHPRPCAHSPPPDEAVAHVNPDVALGAVSLDR